MSVLALMTTAEIQIINPSTVKESLGDENGVIEAGLANFGHIDYGSSIVSFSYLTKPLCREYSSVKCWYL